MKRTTYPKPLTLENIYNETRNDIKNYEPKFLILKTLRWLFFPLFLLWAILCMIKNTKRGTQEVDIWHKPSSK